MLKLETTQGFYSKDLTSVHQSNTTFKIVSGKVCWSSIKGLTDRLFSMVVTVVFTTGELATYGPSFRRLIPPYKRGHRAL